jgi:hypothetical protein
MAARKTTKTKAKTKRAEKSFDERMVDALDQMLEAFLASAKERPLSVGDIIKLHQFRQELAQDARPKDIEITWGGEPFIEEGER